MMRIRTFWAQAIDNQSVDHLEVDGVALPEDEADLRQGAMTVVYAITREGRRLYEQDWVSLTVSGTDFVFEVPGAEVDASGRVAPLLCQGRCEDVFDDAQIEAVIGEIEAFAARIGRSLNDSGREGARWALEVLRKKSWPGVVGAGLDISRA